MATNVIASNNLQWSNNTTYGPLCQPPIPSCYQVWTKMITIIPAYAIIGTIRVYYECNPGNCYECFGDGSEDSKFEIRKNGVSVGTLRAPYIMGWYSYTEDISITLTTSDTLEIWAWYNNYTGGAYVRNFHVSFDTVVATGSAFFTSSPSVARIWIDNIDKGVNTPNTISGLSTGSHSYTLKLAGYQDATGSFSVIAGSTTTVPLVTFLASAYFTSTPTGAAVWVDDTNLDTVTPATVVGLTAGSHTYRLIEAGYTNRGSFSTIAGTTTNVSATLTVVGLNGSIWIEDQYLCYIDANNVVTYIVGTNSGVVAGLVGSIWIEGTQIAYIDASNNKRLLSATAIGAVAGLSGSLWVGGSNIYHIASGIQQASDISLRYSDDVEIFVPNGWQYVKYYTLTTALRRPVTVAFEICINQDIYGGQLGTVRIKDNIYPNVNDHDYSYDVGSWKPYPAGYARIVHEIQVNLVAGNSLYLIIGASSYGLYVKNYRIYY